MSRVYRYEEIQNLQYPTPEDFASELVSLRQGLSSLHEEGTISGALIWDSAVHGGAGPRSDFDIIVSTPDASPDANQKIREVTNVALVRSGIPTDVAQYTEQSLRDGSHGYFQESMLHWLGKLSQVAPENIIGKNPVDITIPRPGDILMRTDRTASSKRTFFARAQQHHSPYINMETTYEEVINLPHHLGRKVVGALIVRDIASESVMPSPKKSHVLKALDTLFGHDDPVITELSSMLTAEGDAYTAFVDEVKRDSITQQEYEQVLATSVKHVLPTAIDLTARVQTAYRSQVAAAIPGFQF